MYHHGGLVENQIGRVDMPLSDLICEMRRGIIIQFLMVVKPFTQFFIQLSQVLLVVEEEVRI